MLETSTNGARAADDAAAGREDQLWRSRAGVCPARTLRAEVRILSRDPDRGNPTSRRQGRGPELAGRLQCGWLRCGASVRAGLKEAIGVSWWRPKVKRRKAFLGWASQPLAAMPGPGLVVG
jgi:hypothetical protein